MAADGLTKGGIDRTLLHNLAQECLYECKHTPIRHPKLPGTSTVRGSASEVRDSNAEVEGVTAPSVTNSTPSFGQGSATFERRRTHGFRQPTKVTYVDGNFRVSF